MSAGLGAGGGKEKTETSGRRFGQSPDTLLVPIASEHLGTRWLFLGVASGPNSAPNKNNAERVVRFLKRHSAYTVHQALANEFVKSNAVAPCIPCPKCRENKWMFVLGWECGGCGDLREELHG